MPPVKKNATPTWPDGFTVTQDGKTYTVTHPDGQFSTGYTTEDQVRQRIADLQWYIQREQIAQKASPEIRQKLMALPVGSPFGG